MSLLKALDASNVAQHLKVNASGALECSVNEIELTATDIHVAVDGLETLQTAANNTLSSIDNKVILPSALSSDNLKVSLKETITVPISGSVTATVSGVSTEAKQDTLISKFVGGATTSGMATAQNQQTVDLTLQGIDGILGNIETDAAALEVLQTAGNNTLSSIDNKIVLPAALDSGKLKVVDGAVVDNGNKIDAMRASDSLTTLKGVLDTIDADTSAINDCIGSNKVNVNISSGNISGFSTSALQGDTNTKLDHISDNLDTLETSNQLIQTTVSSRVGLVNTSVGSLTTANHTDLVALEASLTSMEGKQDTIITHLSEIEGAAETIETAYGLSKCNINISSDAVGLATQATLSDAETHLGNIDTGVDVLEACVGSNKVNVNIASNAVDFATQTTLAAAEVHLGAIDTGIDVLEACVGSNKVNVNIASNAVDFATQTTLAAAEVHLGNLETKITTIDGVLDNSLVKETLATSAEIKELLSGATVNAGTLSAELDTEHYERIRLFGETSASVGSDIKVFGSNTSGGTYYYLNNGDLMSTSLLVSGLGSVHYIGGSFENIPRYIKIFNNNGSSNHTFTKLYMVGSGGRVAV